MNKTLANKAREVAPLMEEQPQQGRGESLGKEENLDVEIASAMGVKLFQTPEAQKTISAAMDGSGDPVAKLGVFFSQLIDKIQNKMESSPMPLSPRIWLSQDGVLDRWVNFLGEQGAISSDMAPAIKDEVMQLLKLQNQSVNKGQAQPPQQVQQVPPPTMQQAEPPMPAMGGVV